MKRFVKCPICGFDTDELIETDGMINGGIGECCLQCLEDYEIEKGIKE